MRGHGEPFLLVFTFKILWSVRLICLLKTIKTIHNYFITVPLWKCRSADGSLCWEFKFSRLCDTSESWTVIGSRGQLQPMATRPRWWCYRAGGTDKTIWKVKNTCSLSEYKVTFSLLYEDDERMRIGCSLVIGHTLLYWHIRIGFYKLTWLDNKTSLMVLWLLLVSVLFIVRLRIMSNKQKIWEQLETVMCLSKNWLRYINFCSFSGHRQWK